MVLDWFTFSTLQRQPRHSECFSGSISLAFEHYPTIDRNCNGGIEDGTFFFFKNLRLWANLPASYWWTLPLQMQHGHLLLWWNKLCCWIGGVLTGWSDGIGRSKLSFPWPSGLSLYNFNFHFSETFKGTKPETWDAVWSSELCSLPFCPLIPWDRNHECSTNYKYQPSCGT